MLRKTGLRGGAWARASLGLLGFGLLVALASCRADQAGGSATPTAVGEDVVPGDGVAASPGETRQAGPTERPEPSPPELTDDELDEFAAYIEAVRERTGIPGVAVAVVQGNDVVFAQGFGVKEEGTTEPVTADTVFGLGSLTQPMTALMVSALVDDGLVTWDEPLSGMEPRFRLADDAASGQASLRHALSHVTGLPNTDVALLFSGASFDEIMAYLSDVPLTAPLGASRSFQNEAFSVASLIAASEALGEPGDEASSPPAAESDPEDVYAALMQERVFEPIGMSSATFSAEAAEAAPDHATPHYGSLDARLTEGTMTNVPTHYWDAGALAPSGGASASATDVGRFLSTMLGDGLSPDGTRVASAAAVDEILGEQVTVGQQASMEGAYEGLGWTVGTYQGVKVAWKEGGTSGFGATMALVPEADVGLVVLANSDLFSSIFTRGVRTRFLELLHDLPAVVDTESSLAEVDGALAYLGQQYLALEAVDPAAVEPYLGAYEGVGEPYRVELREGRLWFGQGALDYVELRPVAGEAGVFSAVSGGDFTLLRFAFAEGADGEMTLNVGGMMDVPKVPEEPPTP